MRKIKVDLGVRSYPIFIGAGILGSGELLVEQLSTRQVLIVTNKTIEPLYLSSMQSALADRNVKTCVLPDGESYKTLEVMQDIITALLEHRFSRDCCLIALGGGVVGDITGFAAACYQRGAQYIQVPTTLLAQVDSSVGGKTAVNHRLGKNMIGAFHQPAAVIADIKVLDTLPERQLSAGLAEVIKYGLIRDAEFFTWLEANIHKLKARDADALIYAVERSCLNKAAVVAADETEQGLRAILNYGHTFGHAIETGLDYQGWLHGEAVGLGMLMAAEFSRRLGWLTAESVGRIRALLEQAGLPVRLPQSLSTSMLRELMAVDKKSRQGNLFLVLLKAIGSSVVTGDFNNQYLLETIDSFQTSMPGSD
ncbi:MAG: 3-dehydroquinate synthase [Gammaproteobacteria bacterium]|nr:3-dehydroquinate synthase [Gammaproteobacteria bacterium]